MMNKLFEYIYVFTLFLCVQIVVLSEVRAFDAPSVINYIANADGCSPKQWDGDVPGGVRQKSFILLEDCHDRGFFVLRIYGSFPVSEKAIPESYHVNYRLHVQGPKDAEVDLASGVCTIEGRLLNGTYAISAYWGERKTIVFGGGLHDIVRISNHGLESISSLKKVVCRSDEP